MKLSCLRFLFAAFFLSLTVSLSAQKLEGMASFYADKFDGLKTSTGEVFRQNGYMAASKDLPWGTIVEVTNLSNGRKVQVRVNDCGPHAKNRIIDLSRRAAQELDFVKKGETKVRLRIVRASNAGPNCGRGAWAKKLKAAGRPIPPIPGPWKPSDTAHLTDDVPVATNIPDVPVVTPAPPTNMRGMASYYADRFEGRNTSTGELYNGSAYTAASNIYPYNTMLEVADVASGRTVVVRVNDCGPHAPDRIIDLSRAAADKIGMRRAGTATVTLRILKLGTDGPTCDRAAWVENIKQNKAAGRRAAKEGKVLPGRSGAPDLPARTTVTPADIQNGTAPETYGNTVTLNPPPAPAPAPGQTTEKAYKVQFGAFRNEAAAYGIYDDLVAKGYVDAYVFQNTDNGLFTTLLQTAYDKATAKKVQQKAVEEGFASAGLKEVQAFAVSIRNTPESKTVQTPPIVAGEPVPATYGNIVPTPADKPAKKTFEPDVILFGVQIGAFSSDKGAQEMMDKLDAAGVDEVYSAKVDKVTRVFAGKFYFQNQANDLKEELRTKGFSGATVRRVQ